MLQKLTAGTLVAVLALAACGLWIFLKDNVSFDEWRKDTLRAITGERAKLVAALDDVRQRINSMSAELAGDREKARQADKIIAELKSLESTWERYIGNPEQQKMNAERLASVTTLRQALGERIDKKQQDITRATWERDGLEIALGKLDVQLRAVEAQRSKVAHYIEETWNYEMGWGMLKLPIKVWIAISLGLFFFGPSVGKAAMFYVVAPFVTRARPVRLAEALPVLPTVSESRAAMDLGIGSGEKIWIREKFLQASDEGLRKRTRMVLDWRIPFTCAAAGLVELVELANGQGLDDGERRLTLSNHGNPHVELAVVTVPEGASIILRPSFLAGVITGEGGKLRIRRRWQLFRFQAWVTFQFRFFEFVGPCRLIVAGSRGIRAEHLSSSEGRAAPARRTNQDATIGFTPNVDYRPARAETFWGYYRGMNPLFDDLFAGTGLFLCQQVATEGEAKKARKFWSGIWNGVMKVFGL